MTTKKGIEASGKGLATKKDLLALGRRLDGEIDATRKDLSDLGQRLDDKIDATAKSLDAKIGQVDATTRRMAVEIVNLQADVRGIKSTMVSHAEFRQGLAAMTAIASRFD